MQTKRNDYHNIEIDFAGIMTESGMVDELFRLEDLKNRKLFLNDEINAYTVADIVKHILQYNANDRDIPVEERRPILLYINSNGGDVDAGFELIDVIMYSKTPVYTINLGWQYSMGFMTGIAGHKRFAMPNSKLLIHDGSNYIRNSGAKAQDQMEFQKRVEERIRALIIERSNITGEEYDAKLRVEWYMFADEAKERGLVDYIIGKDCSIDDVI